MWNKLNASQRSCETRHIEDLFKTGDRVAQFSIENGGLFFDFSKTNIDNATKTMLIALAHSQNLAARRDAMFRGDKINQTEGRAVLHTALRSDQDALVVDGADIMAPIRATLARMERFANELRAGLIQGQGGPITDVVNIGIGGSDLGPAMGVLALAPYHDGPRVHFVSNVDGADISDALKGLDATRTLVIVASKTFSTIETMSNATTAKKWMAQKVTDTGAQFVALSSAGDKACEFGIAPAQVFGFEDWVGGRYSMWGPIGLALMLAVGAQNFRAFLAGGAAMDTHFQEAEFSENMPVMLALVGLWHHQVCGYATRAVLPYDQRLSRLPAYLQQLEMESNGKSVAMDGQPLAQGAGPVIWGEPGTNGQHAFFQLIHQGVDVVPCEFMVAAQGHEPDLAHQHRLLVANCLAQSKALMQGRSLDVAHAIMVAQGDQGDDLERQAPHRVFAGNRPSTTLVYQKLSPFVLGQILALYEHRVFVEGAILGLNSFDQWGVELGKELATALLPIVSGEKDSGETDASTRALIRFLNAR